MDQKIYNPILYFRRRLNGRAAAAAAAYAVTSRGGHTENSVSRHSIGKLDTSQFKET